MDKKRRNYENNWWDDGTNDYWNVDEINIYAYDEDNSIISKVYKDGYIETAPMIYGAQKWRRYF